MVIISLKANNITIKYGEKIAVDKVSLEVNKGEVVTIVGPNGSGKSTLIKAISRSIAIDDGEITLEDINIKEIPTKSIARKVAVLPQVKTISNDITVESLVSYGRFPHLGFMKKLDKTDNEIIQWAMEKTGVLHFRERNVMTLSGGERQRAWISMALAQKPKVLILDEPTTYLDISYQMEVLELVKELNETLGITVIMVLHDLNQAARYSDKIYVLMNGQVCRYGNPKKIMDSGLLRDVFRIDANIYEDKINHCPYFIPNKIV